MIFAFGFGNVAMLGWLAAAAAPLLIHLWSRRRYRETPWAAIELLRAALRKNSRRMRLQQWLLLAIRTLLIVAVVMAVAEPFAGQSGITGSDSALVHRILCIDSSYSMAYRSTDQNLFQLAKSLATNLVRESAPGDAFSLILMGDPPQMLLEQPVSDRPTVTSAISGIQVSHGSGDVAATLALVGRCIGLSPSESAPWDRREVYFFTDLGRTSWQPATELPPAANSTDHSTSLHEQLRTLATKAKFVVIDVGDEHASNSAVTRFRAASRTAVVGQELNIEGTVANFSDKPAESVAVELVVDGSPVAARVIDVPSRGETSVSFAPTFRTAGEHRLELRSAEDRLPVDDHRWMVVSVREELPVLCIAGRQGAADYVARALDPRWPETNEESAILPFVVPDGQLRELDLDRFDCVFMCNVAQITTDEATLLEQYVRQGGGLIVFLGDQVEPAAFNRLASSTEFSDLFPARLGELVSEATYRLDPLEYRHPIVAPFRGRERAGLLTTPVSKRFRLEIASDRTDVETALAIAGGDPLIVTAPLGLGRAVIVATAGALSSVDAISGQPWTLLPAWPSFLPIVREMLAYAGGGNEHTYAVYVGEPIGGPASAEVKGSVSVQLPNGRTDMVTISDSVSGRCWSYDRTDVSGVYSVEELSEPQSLAVNVKPFESDLTRAEIRLLPTEVVVHRGNFESGDEVHLPTIVQQAAMHRALLFAALVLALVEFYLAWRFGRGAARP